MFQVKHFVFIVTCLFSEVLSAKSIVTSTQAPVVAKVLTNAQGQVISVGSLLAHQKQHGSLPQGKIIIKIQIFYFITFVYNYYSFVLTFCKKKNDICIQGVLHWTV